MVADMRSRMSLFVAGLSRLSSKEGRAAMLIGDMDISRLMAHVQQVEAEKMKDREEFKNKRAKTGNDMPILKVVWCKGVVSLLPAPSVVGTTQVFVVRAPLVVSKCPKNKQRNGNGGNRAQSSSVAPLDRAAPRGATSGIGGKTSHLYVINSHQE
ncbi:hypothetical protein R3W88_019438 [Solanum pinnatisectum]|uniref:Gag-pol polyprotein n=1 Tax=Solanum pinnatisectum TaxID=50273 RepID=A0AAV9KJB6_9SOLN|nr:hypothetical protein R3W88_019438 [Solanum pinnatisectum]